MKSNIKKIVIFFLIYKITIIASIVLKHLMQNMEMINSLFATITIVVGVAMYWYVIFNIFGTKKLEKISAVEKTIFFSNLLIKLLEYFVVFFAFSFQNESSELLFCIGLIVVDTLFECKMYWVISKTKGEIVQKEEFNAQDKYHNLSEDKKHLFWLYILSVIYIAVTIIQVFCVVVETDVILEFMLKFLIMMWFVGDYVNMSVKEKKVYVEGRYYLIGILFLILETGVYWILSDGGVYIKATMSAILLIFFDAIIAGPIGKKYNNVKK